MLQRPSFSYSHQSAALDLIQEAQIAQEHSGKKLVGYQTIDDLANERIEGFLKDTSKIQRSEIYDAQFIEAARALLIKFEVLCQRREIPIADSLREHIYQALVDRLGDNTKFFGYPAKTLVTPTLFSSNLLVEEFSKPPLDWFKKNLPGAILRAFVSYPGNPIKFLKNSIARGHVIDEYLSEASRKLPISTARRMAMSTPKNDPKTLVDNHFKLIKKISSEPEFREFYRDRPNFVEHAINSYGEKGARPFLREAHRVYATILADNRFAALRTTPGTIIIAAVHYPNNTEAFLECMLEREERIKDLLKQLGESIGKHDLRNLCLKTPLRAREFEMELTARIATLAES